MFRLGDEVVCVRMSPDSSQVLHHGVGGSRSSHSLVEGTIYVVESVWANGNYTCLHIVGAPNPAWGYDARGFRKVQKRNSSLSIESFLTIKPGFEEPKRETVKPKKEKVK